MTKRIIALLLALILTVGLLPTVALAAEGNPTPDGGSTGTAQSSTVQSGTDSANNDDNPVHVIKTFTPGEDGEFGSLTLEAYVTNPLQVVTETTPLDIVLVLDQSGSMGYCINCGTEFNNEKWDNDQCNTTSVSYQYTVVSRANADKNKTYYTPVDGKYYEADWCDGWHWFGIIPYKDHEEGWYYYGDYGHTRVTGDLYVRTKITGHKHRLDALTEALNTFVNSVVANGGDHNVAVVGYAGTRNSSNDKSYAHNSELLTGTNLNRGSEYSGNDSRYYPQKDLTKDPINGKAYTDLYTSSQEYSRALQSMRTKQGVASVRAAINALTANGATRTYAGMDMAKNILAKAKTANSNRQQVVILFTDGDTNSEQDDVYNLANSMKNNGVLIYTVGLFKDADQTKGTTSNKGDDYNLFLNKVSNNSIEYKNQGSKPRTKTDKTYYLPAQDAASLSAVFAQISREVSKLDLKVDSKAILQDTLSGYFTFDADTNAAGSITVQTAAFKGIDEDGQMKWETPEAATGTDVKVNGKKITVTGFDYGSPENLVTVHENSTPKYTGKKLIVTIPIKPDTTSNVTWNAGSNHLYDTNVTEGDEAGLSGYGYKDKQGTLSTTLPTSPKAPVTGYTVSYVVTGGDSTCPTVAAGDNNKVYIEGQTYEILNPLADTANWKFDGWYFDDAYTRKVTDADKNKTMDRSDVTYYGKWENATATVNLASYVKKTLTATSLPEGYEEIFKAKIVEGEDLNDSTAKTIETDKFTASEFSSTTSVTKAFKELNVILSVGTHTFTVAEIEPAAADKKAGISYNTASQTFTLNVVEGGPNPTIEFGKMENGQFVKDTTKNCVTITNTYAPGESSFSLAQKFQKVLNSNTADVPRKSFELTITGTSDNTGKTTISGTANIGTLTKQNDKYTGSAYFGFSSALKFSTDGIYKYKVQETKGSVAGMSYDTIAYELVIEVENKNGALEIKSARIGETDMKNAGPFTITNTFTAAELPLDPTPDPTDNTKVIPKIVKELRVTSGSAAPTVDLPFTVAVYEGNAIDEDNRVATGTATISHGATDRTKANFTGLGTLVFPTADEYTFTVKETAGDTSGVTYDAKTYTLTVKVEASETDNSLSVTNTYYRYTNKDGEQVEVTSFPITITNTYTEPKEPSVVSKTVVTTDMVDTLPPSVSSDIEAFKNKVDILYPVVNGEASTLEVPYGTKSVTLLYKITVNAGTKTSMQFEDVGAERVSVFDDDNVDVSQVGRTFSVRFYRGVTTADIYVAKTYKNLVFDSNGECTVENVISEEIKATTTVTEKDPNKLTINFADFVQKELTATGSKTASDVDFTVDVKGKEWITIITSAKGEEAISTYADEFDPKYSRTLTAHFDSITGGETKTAPFNGSTVEIDHASQYFFVLTEEKGTRTGVTYDESVYTVYISVEKKEDKLVVAHVTIYKDNKLFDGNTITFHNTIDTGKDDYYPIIIPTIINKDTGMLNKTDHFAYVIGYPDGTVHPNGQITRAEVATIFFRLLRDEVRDGAFTTSNSYSDVAYGKWYNNPISTMSALGIITGYPDGTFKPNKPITRAEFAAIAARFDETQSGKSATFSDVIGHWAAKEIGIAYYNDWIKGYPDGTFKPDQNITRAEAMTLINRVLERKPESPADLLTNMNKWTDNMDTSKWYYLDVQEATNSHGYTRKTFNYELWRQMLPDPDWSRYER